jgi:hypothetical protein
MSNKRFLKEFGALVFIMAVFVISVLYIIENVDYVETYTSNLDFAEGTVQVTAIIHVDDDPVKGLTRTVDYCDRKIEKKKLKAEAKEILKEFKKGNCK